MRCHQSGAAAFARAVEQGGPAAIPLDEILEVSLVTTEVAGRIYASMVSS